MPQDSEYSKFYSIGYEYGFDRVQSLVIIYTDAAEQGYRDGVTAGELDRAAVNRDKSSNT